MIATFDKTSVSRLLVVEDDLNQMRTLKDILKSEGFEVVGCATATESLQQLETSNFSVAIIDLLLPDLEGTQLLAKMREITHNIRVIIHTAYGSFDSAKAAVNLGAHAYVEKLGDPAELIRHVHEAIRGQLTDYTEELEERVAERTVNLTQLNQKLREQFEAKERIELELRKIQEELEQRVEERTSELQETNEKLVCEVSVRAETEETLRREEGLLKQLLELHENERQHIAYGIHDGFVQHLTGAIMRLETISELDGLLNDQAKEECLCAISLVRDAIREAKRLISLLRPPILDEEGIVEAIEYLLREPYYDRKLTIQFDSEIQFQRLDPLIESALFRITQEALSNIHDHSQANRACVELIDLGTIVRLKIQDWGIGFDQTLLDHETFGLQAICERARLLGGKATINSTPSEGTCVEVDLPLTSAQSNESRELV